MQRHSVEGEADDLRHRAWSALTSLNDSVLAPWGEVAGHDAVWGFANETLVHGWDVAVATGQPSEAAADLVEPVLERAHKTVPKTNRNMRAYRPVLESRPVRVPPNA